MMVTMMMVIALVQGPMMTRRHLYSYTWGLWLKGFVLKAFVLDSGTWDVNTQNHIYIYIHMYMGFEDFGIQCSGSSRGGRTWGVMPDP